MFCFTCPIASILAPRPQVYPQKIFVKIGKGNHHICCLCPTESKDKSIYNTYYERKVLDQPLKRHIYWDQWMLAEVAAPRTAMPCPLGSLGRQWGGHHVACCPCTSVAISLPATFGYADLVSKWATHILFPDFEMWNRRMWNCWTHEGRSTEAYVLGALPVSFNCPFDHWDIFYLPKSAPTSTTTTFLFHFSFLKLILPQVGLCWLHLGEL